MKDVFKWNTFDGDFRVLVLLGFCQESVGVQEIFDTCAIDFGLQ